MDMKTKLDGVVVTKQFTVKADNSKGAPEKSLKAQLDYSSVSVQDVVDISTRPEVIKIQALVRNNWASYKEGETIKVKVGEVKPRVVKQISIDDLLENIKTAANDEEKAFWVKKAREVMDAIKEID